MPGVSVIASRSTRAAWNSDGSLLACVALDDGGVVVRDARTLAPRFPVSPLRQWSVPVFVSDGRTLAVAGGEGEGVWVMDLGEGRAREWTGDGDPRRRPGSTVPAGLTRVLVPTPTGLASWPLAEGTGEGPRSVSRVDPPRRLRTRPHVSTVVVETGVSRFDFLDAATLEAVWPAIPLESEIDDDFDPNGLTYASAQRERWGQLWDLTTGSPLGEPALRPCLMPRVRFTPDGRRIVLFGDPGGTAGC